MHDKNNRTLPALYVLQVQCHAYVFDDMLMIILTIRAFNFQSIHNVIYIFRKIVFFKQIIMFKSGSCTNLYFTFRMHAL